MTAYLGRTAAPRQPSLAEPARLRIGQTPAMEKDPPAARPERNPASLDLEKIILAIVSDCTGYPADMLDLDQEIEADLGIDSIKRMQTLEELETALSKNQISIPEGNHEELARSLTLRDLLNNLQKCLPAAGSPSAADWRPSSAAVSATPEARDPNGLPFDVAATLMAVVSDLSGYPVDMLDPGQEIVGDLGIDSIKRMQILAHFEARLENLRIDLTDADREHLAESVTLKDIIAGLEALLAKTPPEKEDRPAPASEVSAPVKTGTPVPASDASAAAPLPDAIRRQIYQVVEKHTGFPAEALEPDLDLKSDLNMDTALTEAVMAELLAIVATDLPDRHRPLSPARLGDLTDWLARVPQAMPAETPAPEPATDIRRFTLVARQRELVLSPDEMPAGGTILITHRPSAPRAEAVIARLASAGRKVLVLEHQPEPLAEEKDAPDVARYQADFRNHDDLAEQVNRIRQAHGPISALLHLLPLSASEPFAAMSCSQWRDETAVQIKSLFYLAKLLLADLTAAAGKGPAGIVAATALGGTFASADDNLSSDPPVFSPVTGGISGFLKALAEETAGLNIRVVDNDPGDTPEAIAGQVVNELLTPSADIEVGYRQGSRLVLDIAENPLVNSTSPVVALDNDSKLLITGGARGITAAVALALARRFRPTLLLVGRTPLAETEAEETKEITEEKQLKAVLANQLKSQSRKIRPKDLEEAYHLLLSQREIRENLRQLRETGADVHYLPGDVTDAEGFPRLIAGIYEQYGNIDGVIHGAGRIEDRMIKDKEAAAFDRVFDTKADSLFILSRALRPETLRFLALFSSVAGRFGNAGQSDYGAANEVYNKTALYLNRHWPGRVVSFIWGPWESRGMVSERLRQKFSAGGITLIPRDVGAKCFVEELCYGPAYDTEVVYGGWDDRKRALTSARRTARLPLLSFNTNFYPSNNGNVELIRRLDRHIDHYLQDHKLDGHPVVPMAIALEMMAEAVAYRYPDYYLQALNDVHVLKGIILNGDSAHIRITADAENESDQRVSLRIRIGDNRDRKRLYYRARAELVRGKPPADRHDGLTLKEPTGFPLSVAEAYRRHLFHGPLWQGIDQVEAIGQNGIIGHLKTSRPEAYLRGKPADQAHSWLIDPLVIDSGLQLVALWMRNRMNATPLPSRLNRYVMFDTPVNGHPLRCEVCIRVPENGGIKSADISFLTSDGRLSGMMEGLEIIGSESLNRLAEKQETHEIN